MTTKNTGDALRARAQKIGEAFEKRRGFALPAAPKEPKPERPAKKKDGGK